MYERNNRKLLLLVKWLEFLHNLPSDFTSWNYKTQFINQLEKTARDHGWGDRISLTHDLQPPMSYGHDLLTCKSPTSMVSCF